MSVRKWMFAGALLLAAGLSSLGFAQKPGLKFNPDKKIKIVQLTDLHVKWQDPRSDIAFERMNQVLDDEKPDLVIFTGDIIYSKPALENMRPFFGSAATVIGYFNTQNIFLSCDPHKDISFFTLL